MKNNKPFTKKIIAGKYKSTVLDLPSKVTTRSSKTIVLESFFNTLQYDIMDATFVELFAGSGSIGLEALSRGAKEILFLERDRDALGVLKKNIAKTDPSSCKIISGDSFVNIQTVIDYLKEQKTGAYLYIDPPFSIREGMQDIYDKMINLIEKFPQTLAKMIIIEHMSGLDMPAIIGDFHCKKSKKFGKTTLTYYVGVIV